MTNDELKKKIVDTMHPILKGTRVSCNEDNACEHCIFPCGVDRIADRLADALIAAGYGDVSELKKHRVVVEKSLIPEKDNIYVLPNIPPTVKQLYSGEEVENIVKEREEYKHRAERAERALKYAVSEYRCDECPNIECNAEIRGSLECIKLICAEYKKQAEKELA